MNHVSFRSKMTLNQLYDLTEDELALALVIVYDIAPPVLPKGPFEPRHLTWFRHDHLIKKLVDSFPKLSPEGHATYISLMHKLVVCIQIHKQQPELPSTASIQEVTGSV